MTGESGSTESLADGDGYVDICVGISRWLASDGRLIVEKDFKVDGEIWRVVNSTSNLTQGSC